MIAGLLVVPALVSCGFHLRGQATYAFSSVYVNTTGAPAFDTELKRALEGAGSAKVAPTAAGAQVILDIPPIGDEKDVLSLSGGGSVREYQLVMRVTSACTTPTASSGCRKAKSSSAAPIRSTRPKCWRAISKSSVCYAKCRATRSRS
jgi:outer membrane lipopolysaccharide assembly protein LptE/RlpB